MKTAINENILELIVFILVFTIPSSLLIFFLLDVPFKEKIALFLLYISMNFSIIYLFFNK